MTPQPRSIRLAPLLVVAGCVVAVLFGGYAGGYFWLGRHTAIAGDVFVYVEFDAEWSSSIYYPAVVAEAKIRRSPLVITCQLSPGTYQSTIVE